MESVIDETIFEKIQNLMDTGSGDLGRLRFIMMTLRKGKPLYHSDQKFLEEKLNSPLYVQEEKIIEEQTETQQIIKLIELGIGDTGRLQSILERIQKNKPLYNSDKKYLQEKINSNNKKEPKQTQVQVKSPDLSEIKSLKLELDKANKRISNLESTIQENKDELKKSKTVSQKTTKIVRGTMPEGWSKPKKELMEIDLTKQEHELESISTEIKNEQEKIEIQKKLEEKLELEKSKLTQLILDRKEYEKQIKIEQEQLEENIIQEKNDIKEKLKIKEQIKKRKEELKEAKSERDDILKQLREKKKFYDNELAKQENDIEQAKIANEQIISKTKQK